jgi:phosphatidylethanolamine-binding protein (PEBP) family uncharacterized protein
MLSRGTRMRISTGTLPALALAGCVALAGCGSSSSPESSPPPEINTNTSPAASGQVGPPATTPTGTSSSSSSTADAPNPPKVSITVKIPGLLGEHRIPVRYTCDGADVSLPIQWSHIPHGTVELVMFLANLRPIHQKPFFDWAVAGLSPSSHGVTAGKLPAGAIVGRNSFGRVGYSICPAKGTGEEDFALRLVALSHRSEAKSGFNTEALYQLTERSTLAAGLSGGIYTRR